MEVSAVRSKWVRIGCVAVFLSLAVGSAAMASSPFGTSFNLGEEIQFKIDDSTTWLWGCCSGCCCEDSLVRGWRIANASGQVVYSVIHDAPVSSAIWQGSWTQLDMNNISVPVGDYKLYVDTSVGTLSRCFTLRDPCNCYNRCNWCTSSCTYCEDVSSISECGCRTTLVFVEDDACASGCFPFFWWGSCSSNTNCGCWSCP